MTFDLAFFCTIPRFCVDVNRMRAYNRRMEDRVFELINRLETRIAKLEERACLPPGWCIQHEEGLPHPWWVYGPKYEGAANSYEEAVAECWNEYSKAARGGA